ncbi:MAG: peptide deformylase [Anaerolineae bacterium]|nr:peptide deformylase [Anaerolineae bacterium]
MAVKKILTIDKYEKQLRTKTEPVKKITKELKQLFQDIKDTIEANPAVGLAAPQIGVMKRIFGVRLGYKDDQPENEDMQPPIILINPEILEEAPEVERGWDACLSIPGMMGYTERNLKIRVRYMDEDGKTQEREFEGFDARAVQHEIDHLNGVLFTDRLANLGDLYVYVKDAKGKRKPVPYPEAVRRAAEATDGAVPVIPALPSSKK